MTALPLHSFAGPPMLAETARGAGSLSPPLRAPGSRRAELARHLRLYGGPSLETRRDDARDAMWLSGALFIASSLIAELFAGWGIAAAFWFGVVAFIAALIFAGAVHLRSKNERRIEEAEGRALRAVAAALSDPSPREMGRAA